MIRSAIAALALALGACILASGCAETANQAPEVANAAPDPVAPGSAVPEPAATEAAAAEPSEAAPAGDAPVVPHVTGDDFQAQVLESPLPVVIDFYADWCGPCKVMAPHVAAVAAEYAGAVRVFKLDIEDWPDIPERYSVTEYPSLLVFVGGEPTRLIEGFQEPEELQALFAAIAPKPE